MRVQAPAARSLQLQFVPLRRAWLRSFADRREFVRSVGSGIPSESAPLPERRAPASAGIIRLKRNSRGANARHQPQFDACSKDAASWITNLDHGVVPPPKSILLGLSASLGSKSQKSDWKPTATLPRMLPLSPCCHSSGRPQGVGDSNETKGWRAAGSVVRAFPSPSGRH